MTADSQDDDGRVGISSISVILILGVSTAFNGVLEYFWKLLSVLERGVDWAWIRRDVLRFFAYATVFSASSAVVTQVWFIAWEEYPAGAVRLVVDGINESVTLVDVPLFVSVLLLAFVCGLLSVFPADTYKRYEGVYVLAGVVAVVSVASAEISQSVLFSSSSELLVGGLIGVGNGHVLTRRLRDQRMKPRKYREGFSLMMGVILLWSLVGVGYLAFVSGSLVSDSGLIVLFGLAAVVGQHQVLTRFVTYSDVQDVFLLGPERSGKTYFIGALAFTLLQRRSEEYLANPVSLGNEATITLYTRFQNGKFDEVESTDPDDVNVYELTFTTGGLFRTDLRFRVPDYDGKDIPEIGEKLDSLDVATAANLRTDLHEDFRDKVNPTKKRGLRNRVAELLLPRPTSSDDNLESLIEAVNEDESVLSNKDDRVTLLTYFLLSADTVFCLLPMDDFIGHLNRDQLPDYWPNDAGDETSEWDSIPPRMTVENYESVYESVCRSLVDSDVFFLMTKSDGFSEVFSGDPDHDAYGFRREVIKGFVRSRQSFRPAVYLDYPHQNPLEEWTLMRGEVSLRQRLTQVLTEPSPYVPVFIRPDRNDTKGFRPDVSAQKIELIWGLEYLFRRI